LCKRHVSARFNTNFTQYKSACHHLGIFPSSRTSPLPPLFHLGPICRCLHCVLDERLPIFIKPQACHSIEFFYLVMLVI